MSKRILIIGAHPDDPEVTAGGTAVYWVRSGFRVRYLAMTNGDTGHHLQGGGVLARRRRAEAAAAAALIGAESEVFDIHNGALLPTLENRERLMRELREYQPDIVLTHRLWDYHPDHRYAAQLVHDCAFSVTVPNVLALTEPLRRNPIILYLQDRFQKPYPFQPDVIVDIEPVLREKVAQCACHESQFFEWLPYSAGYEGEIPTGKEERLDWLTGRLQERFEKATGAWRDSIIERYGETGKRIRYAEAFEVCEYGSPLTPEKERELFPFLSEK